MHIDYQFNLIPDLTLAENCLIPTVAAGINRRTAQERLQDLTDALASLTALTTASRSFLEASVSARHSAEP